MTRPPGTDNRKQSNPNSIGDRPGVQGRCGAGSGPSIRGSALPCLLRVARGEKSPKAISVSAAAAAAPVVSAAAPGHGDLVVSAAELPHRREQQRAPAAASAPPPPRPSSSDSIAIRRPTLAALTRADDDTTSLPWRARSSELALASSLRRARHGEELAPATSPRQDRPNQARPGELALASWPAPALAPASSLRQACPGKPAPAS